MYSNINKLFKTGLHDIKPGLERIFALLDSLDSPHDKINYVIVGGTNGKYSVARIISEILENNSFKTGLYTSPHLVEVTERIKVNGEKISREQLDSILGMVFKKCSVLGIELSYFELITAAAFIYFYENDIDLGVLEVGMGGRWDATNVVTPLISVITNISFDHMKYLGDTIHEIASEKAEIIKQNGIVVTGASKEGLEVISQVSFSRNCDIYILGEEFECKRVGNSVMDYKGLSWRLNRLETNLSGIYQVQNIAIAVCSIEILNNNFNYVIDQESIKHTLKRINVEGRFELFRSYPPLIMDGAHNEAAADALIKSINYIYGDMKFVFLITMLNDKDHDSFLKKIIPFASRIILTQIPDDRCASADELGNKLSEYYNNYEIIEDPLEAFEILKNGEAPSCITGSFYLVGYLKGKMKNEKNRAGI